MSSISNCTALFAVVAADNHLPESRQRGQAGTGHAAKSGRTVGQNGTHTVPLYASECVCARHRPLPLRLVRSRLAVVSRFHQQGLAESECATTTVPLWGCTCWAGCTDRAADLPVLTRQEMLGASSTRPCDIALFAPMKYAWSENAVSTFYVVLCIYTMQVMFTLPFSSPVSPSYMHMLSVGQQKVRTFHSVKHHVYYSVFLLWFITRLAKQALNSNKFWFSFFSM